MRGLSSIPEVCKVFSHRYSVCILIQRLPLAVKNSLGVHTAAVEKKISQFSTENSSLLHWLKQDRPAAAVVSRSSSASTPPPRVSARPDFTETDGPILPSRVWVPPDVLTVSEMEAAETILDFE